VLDVLKLLSVGKERQAEYLQKGEIEVEELLLQFDDVLSVARARLQNNTVEAEEFDSLRRVAECIDDVSSGCESLGGLRSTCDWSGPLEVSDLNTVA
jgi:hypothetical protein